MARKASAAPATGGITSSAASRRRAIIGDRYRLEGTYERLRRALIEAPDDGRLDKSLSYWVLPTDRRLPIAFLDRSLRDLLSLPLEDLMETQGVGHKKILGFFDLLRRAHKAKAPNEPFGLPGAATATPEPTTTSPAEPAGVSEAVWNQWCETILRTGLGRLPLGRVAPSLKPLPSVIWRKPIGDYATLSLSEIRNLKTHGEKRVNAIIEVFGIVYEAVSTAALHEYLELELTPRFVPAITRWLVSVNREPERVSVAELQEYVARPLVHQVSIDLEQQIADLAAERLGLKGPAPTVTEQAERLGVTRARVYQLLEDCARTLEVRWPEGRWMLAPLASKPAETDPEAMSLIHGVRSLFYPE